MKSDNSDEPWLCDAITDEILLQASQEFERKFQEEQMRNSTSINKLKLPTPVKVSNRSPQILLRSHLQQLPDFLHLVPRLS